jgi:hypothetical protein
MQLSLVLLAVYMLCWSFYPWRPLAELDIPAWMVKFASDTAQLLQDTKAPVVTLGTSLIDAPIVQLNRPHLYQEALTAAGGQNLSTDVLAVPGSMMSDQAFIVHELFSNKRKPSLLILTYAPRDFMDNEVADRIASTPTRRVVNFINKRQLFWPTKMTISSFGDCLANHLLFADLLRRHWLRTLVLDACFRTGHPLTLWDSSRLSKNKNQIAEPAPPSEATGGPRDAQNSKTLKLDLDLYNRRYNPYNERRTSTQLACLQELLDDCKRHSLPVQMIGMPISPANKKLLKPDLYESLKARIRAIAERYNAGCIDLNTVPGVAFDQSDFGDSVHLSKAGSSRFLPLYTQSILNSPSYTRAFPQAHR